MIYNAAFALQLCAAIRKDVDKKMHFAMKSLIGVVIGVVFCINLNVPQNAQVFHVIST